MTQKNIKYYFEQCNMSIEQIAEKTGLSIQDVKALLVNPPVYIPEYQGRNRQQYKPFWKKQKWLQYQSVKSLKSKTRSTL